mmetsp:Transcript_30798/g.42154  ORF Transcript_30798/g.42154 Transcript_30798/m.42154 type:complete len:182 (+) Transcript_30798:235-780(+)
MSIIPERIVDASVTFFHIELTLFGLLETKVESANVCASVSNILDRLTRSCNPSILEMIANPDIDLPTKLLRKVIDLLKPHPTRRMSPSQQSTLVTNAALLVGRMVAWHAPQAAVLQPLMVELLLLVPDEVEVVSAALTAIPLLPTIVDPSLLARLGPWIEMVHGNADVRGHSADRLSRDDL